MTKKIRFIIFVVLLLGFISMSGLAYYYANKASSIADTASKGSMVKDSLTTGSSTNEVANLVYLVGKLIVLPTGEEPTIATVSDPTKLKDQLFFANAKIGDKVLIYQNALKAYLYSVSMNKLIEVAPINVGASSTTTPATATTPASKTTTTKKP